MASDWAWLNGKWIPADQLAIPVWDAGFVYGATVTDLCRTIGHHLFLWPAHVQRFLASAEMCAVALPYSASELTAVAEELVLRQTPLLAPWEDLALVLFATPGPIPQYRPISSAATNVQPTNQPGPTVGLHTFRLPLARYARLWREGFDLVSVPQAPPCTILPRRAKHRSRLHWWLAQRQAEHISPGATALLCESDGEVLETAFANVVLVFSNTLVTPPLDHVLPGISLQYVSQLAHLLGWQTEYRSIYPDDVRRADEAFLTSSSFCILPVSRVDGKPFPCPGSRTTQLLQAWSESVGFDLLVQLATAEKDSTASC